MLILISDAFDKELPSRLARFGEVTDDKSRLAEAEVVLVRSKTKVTREYIDSAPALRLVIRGGVGLDNIDVEYARSKGIEVANTPEASTVAVAELAFALMIALPNHIAVADRSMREQQWLKKELERTELMGKTLAILGFGRIGIAVAVRARAFHMRVLAWHPRVRLSDFAEMRPDLLEMLGEADYISLHLPLRDDTRGFFDRDKLAACKDGAFLINTARAGVVVEEDVVAALESGKLGGYATDVWPSDPPPWDRPIFNAPRTLFTPHIGASTVENMKRIGRIAEHIIADYVARKQAATGISS